MTHNKRKNKILSLVGMLLVFTLIITACGTTKEEKKVVKIDDIESEEIDSGGLVADIANPDENEAEELEDKENEEVSATNGEVTTTSAVKNLTVATYNIAAGKLVNFDYSVLAADIRNSGADVVALQEVDQMTLRNGSQDTMAILSAETGMQYYAFAPALSPYQEGEYGIAVLSKYPIESYMYFDLPKLSTKEEQRVLLHTEINVGGTTFDFFVTHGQQSSIREQLTAANDYIASSSKFIYAGDFNTSKYENFQLIGNSYTIIGSANPLLTTANHSFDNMVISNNIKSSNVSVIKTGHSDHHMVLANVVIPAGN